MQPKCELHQAGLAKIKLIGYSRSKPFYNPSTTISERMQRMPKYLLDNNKNKSL